MLHAASSFRRVLLSFIVVGISVISFSQSLDVSSCPIINKRSNGNGQASSSPGNFPGYSQNNTVAANVVGTSYQTVSYNPSDKTGNVNFRWTSSTTVTNLPVITRVWLTANGATSGSLSAIKFGPPPPPTVVGQHYYASYSFYGQNMPAAGKVTLEFADPQTSRPAFRCTFELHSNGTTTEPVIDCTPTIITQPSSQSLCAATTASFTVAGYGATDIQWQVNNSGTWTNISNSGDYSGATSGTLTISNPATYDGKSYRAVLSSSGCTSATSNTALLIAKPKPTAVFSTGSAFCGTGTRSMGVNLAGTGPWSITYSATPSGGSATNTTISNISSSPFYFSVNPSITTTYAITAVSDAYCSNSSPTGNVSSTISAAPAITPTNATTCYGSNSFSLAYTATGSPNQYTLTAGTRAMSGFSTITNASLSASPVSVTIPSNTAAGVYDFNLAVTNSTTGCTSASVAFTVTVAALPTVSASAGSGSVCAGSTATLTAAPSGLSSYSWTDPQSTVVGTSISPSVTVNSNTTYTVRGTDANGCSATANVTVSTVSGPTLSISPTSPSICNGNATTLTASGGNTYSWSPSTGLSATTGSSVVASPTSTTTYTVTSANITGCQSVGTVTVTVNSPTIGVTSSATICAGGSKALTATGGTSYSWYPSTGLSATTGSSVTATPSATTTYYVVGTDANGCSATATSTVSISAAPVDAANSVGSTYSFCSSSSSSFSLPVVLTGSVTSATWAYATTSGGTYTNLASGATTIGSGGSAATFTVSASGLTNTLSVGSYSNGGYGGPRYLRLVIVGASCTYNYDITLYDIKGSGTAPTPTADKATVCSGESTVLSIGGLNASVTIKWQSAATATGTYADISGATSSTYTTSNLTSGTNNFFKAVLSTSGGGGCSYTTGYLQVAVASAAASNTVSPSTSCTDGSSTIALTGSSISGATYQWQSSTTSSSSGFSDVLGAVNQNYSLPNTTVSSATWFRRIATAGNCSATTSTEVAVYAPLANNQVSNSVTSYCTTASATTLSTTTPVGGDGTYTYQWQSSTDGTNFTNIASNGVSQNYTTTSQTQSYWYRRVVTSGGCTSTSGSFKITVNTTPAVTVTAGSTQCAGTSVTLTASGATTYSWSPSTELSATTGSSVVATATATRTYTVTGTDGNACTGTATSTITVTAAPSNPTLSSSTKTICNGSTASLNAQVTSGGTYEWYTAPQVSATYLVSNATAVSAAGSYYVFAKSSGCYSTGYATLTLGVNDVSAPSVAATAVSYCSPATADLTALQPAAASGASLEWHTVSSNPTAGNLVASPSTVSGGTYYLYAYSSAGACYGAASSAVTVTINSVTNASVSSTTGSVCSPSTIDLTTYNNTSGSNNTYSWYNSNSPVAANLVAIPSQISQSGTYYLYVTNAAGCQGAASSGVALTVNSKPTASISSPASVCGGASSSIVATTNASSPSYTWDLSSNNGTSWSAITNAGVYSGATSGTLAVSNTTGLGGNFYRYTVTSSNACTATSDAAILVEETSPTVSTQPVDVSVGAGSTATFTASNSGSPTASYQWQVSTNGGTSFSDIADNSTYSGSNETVLVISNAGSSLNNYKYRVNISNSCATVTSNSALLTVTACTPPTPGFTASPSSAVCLNTDVVYTTQSGQSGYVWSVPGTLNTDYSISSGGTGSSSNTVTLNWLTNGNKTVTVNYSSGGCAGTTAASNTATVNAVSVGGSISGGATVCTGTNSTTLTLSGHTGSITKWQSATASDFSGTVTDISNTTTSLTATNLTAATYYRAVVQSGVCAAANSAAATITVNAASVGGSIGGGATVCTGTNSTTLTLSGHTGSITKWQSATASDFSGTVTDISNTTTSLTATNLTATTYYRAVVQSGVCTAANSATATITVNAASAGGSIGGGATVCTGTNSTTLTLSGHTGSITKWQSATASDFSGTVTDISNTTTSLTATNLSATTYYRSVVQNGSCSSANSGTATITVNTLPVVGINPSATAITTGSATTLTASGANTYSWSSSTGLSATTGAAVTASPTSTITYTVTGTNTTTNCSNTATVVVTVNPALSAGSIGSSQSICSGSTPSSLSSATAASGGTGAISYQWQQSSNNSSFTNITGATGATYTPAALTQTMYYRRGAGTSNDVTVYTNVITITVHAKPTVSITPSTATITAGNSASLSASGANSYNWTPSTALSATNTAAVVASPTSTITYTVTGTDGNSCSNTATITVTVNSNPAVLGAGVIGSSQVICSGSSPAAFTSATDASGGTGAISYQWQQSSDNTSFTNISGATSATYTPSSLTQTTYYRRGAQTNIDAMVYTGSITVTVQSSVGGSVGGAAVVCAGTNNTTLTLSGYTGSVTKWQSAAASDFSGTVTDITNTTTSVTATNLTTTTYYRAVIQKDACTTANSATTGITVNALPVLSITPVSAALTTGSGTSLTATGAGAYSWSPSTGLSATNTSVVTASPTTTTTYTVTGTNSSTGCTNTASVTVTVNSALTTGSIGASQTICSGSAPSAFTSSATASGGTGTITYQWQQGTDNVNFTNIAGAVSATYAPSALTQTTYYKRGAGTAADATVYSNTVTATVLQIPVISGAILGDCAVNKDTSKLYSVTPATHATSYMWSLPAGWSGSSTGSSISVKTGNANGAIRVVPYNETCAGAAVSFPVAVIDYAKVTITASPVTVLGDNNSTSLVTIQLIDVNGNQISCSGGIATLCTSSGTFTNVADHNNGTYSARLRSSANKAEICGTVGGVKILQTITTSFTGPQGYINGNGPIFATETPALTFRFTEGIGPFTVIYKAGSNSKNDTLRNVVNNTPVPVATISTSTLYQLISIIGTDNARRDNNFTKDTATIVVLAPRIIVTLKSDQPKLVQDSVYIIKLSVKVKNIGDVDLSNVQVKANLADVFPNPVVFTLDSVSMAGSTIIPNNQYDGRQNFDLFSWNRQPVSPSYDRPASHTAAGYANTIINAEEVSGLNAVDGEAAIQPFLLQEVAGNEPLSSTAVAEESSYEEPAPNPYFFATLSRLPVGVEGDIFLYLKIRPNGYYKPYVMQVAAVGTGQTASGTALTNSLSNDNENQNLHPEVTRKGDPLPTVISIFPSPSIGVALSVSKPVQQPDSSYNVGLSYVIKNYGNVNLKAIALYQNLLQAIGTPSVFKLAGSVIASDALLINPGYDGKADTNLLGVNSVLGVNQQATVQFTVNITPNQVTSLFRFQAMATGFSAELNTTVKDLSTDGTDADADGNLIPDERLISVAAINRTIPLLVSGSVGIINTSTSATVVSKAFCGPTQGVVVISATTTQGGIDPYQYQWQRSVDNTNYTDIANATDSSYTTGNLTSNVYLRRRVISGNQQVYSNPVYIQINPVSTAVITPGGSLALGINGSISLTASSGQLYDWSNNETARSITVLQAGKYWVKVTDNNGCSGFSDTVFVMPPPPVADRATYIIGAISNPANVGVQVQFTAPGAVLYYYANASGGNRISIPVLPGVTGEFAYYVSQSANGLESVRVPVWVTILDPAKVADLQKVLSKPATLQADGSFIMGFTIRTVNLRPELLDSIQIRDDLSKTFPSPMNFDVVSVRATGKLIANNLFNGNTQVDLLAHGSQLPGYQRDSVTVTIRVNPNGFAGNLDNTAEQLVKSPYGSFKLLSTDPAAANNGGTVRIPTRFTLPAIDIMIPGGFSPNKDGRNDTYVITRPFNTKISLEVFNRWGNVVYRSTDYHNEWDGRTKQAANILGDELPDGTYYYIVLATDKTTGAVRKFNGSLTLKRSW